VKALRQNGLPWIFLFAIFFIAGCESTTGLNGTFDAKTSHWQGRMSLKVQSAPPQAFAADFDLLGTVEAGSLTFTSPLGTTLARLQWDRSAAFLHSGGQSQRFDSLDALTRHTLGTELPIASLFSWLHGTDIDTPGWQADLHDLPAGRLNARRVTVDAPAQLKIILEH
jgi:outer membrane lipoprotein LolB